MNEKPLTGTSNELARTFQKYEQAGISHLIITHSPTTLRGLERLAEAVDAYLAL